MNFSFAIIKFAAFMAVGIIVLNFATSVLGGGSGHSGSASVKGSATSIQHQIDNISVDRIDQLGKGMSVPSFMK